MVYSYPVNIQDCWEGPRDVGDLKKQMPNEMTFTIRVPFIDSMKLAKLDINETTVIFEYPETYYLDYPLLYQVNPDSGSAKFDKSKKTLTIKLPITGFSKKTEDFYKKIEDIRSQ